ncbi:MAG: EscU/YscU/HrcU family type III secretion system export apparatus switch protein [Legionellaceae bacterium]|nr:EscU/YscU/HrcU family type III secretion system export apparatus switch protein [Legionellaceae bacterium]
MKQKKTQAIALKYDGTGAPRVTAKGEQAIAEQIIKIAEEYNIPLHHDPELTQLLAAVELQHEIPQELYVAVAQLLSFLYYITGKTPEDYSE